MTDEIQDQTPSQSAPTSCNTSAGSTLDAALALNEQQVYLIDHQRKAIDALIKHARRLRETGEDLERENERLRTELKGHKEGKLWTLLAAMIASVNETVNHK